MIISSPRFSRASAFLLLASALGLAACGGGNDNLPPPPLAPALPPTIVSTVAAPEPVKTAEPKPLPPPPPVALNPGEASADPPAPLPTARIASPSNDQVIPNDKANDFAVKLDVKNWLIATGSAHVHVILDNKPYKAIFDLKAPIKLSDLTGGETLAEGQHVLIAFPSRANHESVKTKGAIASVEFYVGKKKPDEVMLKKPLLVFSRPKGEYNGDNANHVLVDFQLLNTALGEGKEKVSLTVTGPGIEKELSAKISKFGPPFFLDNLQDGSYALKLELQDKDGKTLPGAWNSTSRTIKVSRAAATDNPHAGHTMPATTAPPAATSAAPANAPKK
jgi:hypothetical protein